MASLQYFLVYVKVVHYRTLKITVGIRVGVRVGVGVGIGVGVGVRSRSQSR